MTCLCSGSGDLLLASSRRAAAATIAGIGTAKGVCTREPGSLDGWVALVVGLVTLLGSRVVVDTVALENGRAGIHALLQAVDNLSANRGCTMSLAARHLVDFSMVGGIDHTVGFGAFNRAEGSLLNSSWISWRVNGIGKVMVVARDTLRVGIVWALHDVTGAVRMLIGDGLTAVGRTALINAVLVT